MQGASQLRDLARPEGNRRADHPEGRSPGRHRHIVPRRCPGRRGFDHRRHPRARRCRRPRVLGEVRPLVPGGLSADPGPGRGIHRPGPGPGDRRHQDRRRRNVRGLRRAQRDSLSDFEIETLPGVFLGQRNIPVGASGRVRARRPVSADRLGAHDDRHRQGRRGAHGSPPAPRRSVARSRPPPIAAMSTGRRRRDLPPRRRAGRGRHWRSAPRPSARSTCWPDRATPTSPRPSGSCSARSASTCSPGPTEILVDRRRARRPVHRRRRPAQPGRARSGLAGRPDHHQPRRRQAGDRAHRPAPARHADPRLRRSRPGATTAR